MATYNDLTAEQKADLQAFLNFMRGACSDLAKIMVTGRAISSGYVGNMETLLGTITDGAEVIPDSSGLAGAVGMSKNDLVTLAGYFITMSETADNASGSYNTNYHRSLYAKACGAQKLA